MSLLLYWFLTAGNQVFYSLEQWLGVPSSHGVGPFLGCGMEFHPSLQHSCLDALIKAFSSCILALKRCLV